MLIENVYAYVSRVLSNVKIKTKLIIVTLFFVQFVFVTKWNQTPGASQNLEVLTTLASVMKIAWFHIRFVIGSCKSAHYITFCSARLRFFSVYLHYLARVYALLPQLAIPELHRELGRVSNFNQSINWHHHMKDHIQSYLTKFDAFKINRDQVIYLETWSKIHTNVCNVETASPKTK